MVLTKTTISLLCVILALSIFMASLLNIIATDHNFYFEHKNEGENHTRYLEKKYGVITDTPNNLIWFLQISDIHISIFRDSGRITQFQQFCDNTVRKIKPMLVLATGDLTDAKTKDNLGSSQVKKEWIYYHNIVQESGVTQHTTWLDIRGNHDNFNIKDINSNQNFFRNYSVQGSKHSKSYVHFENKNGVNVAFLGIDACPDPGLKRPFNFIGILNSHEQQVIMKLRAEAEAGADHIIWFGHYPTSCILTVENDAQRLDLRGLIGSTPQSQVYVCGHLHSMGGLVPKMYTKQKRGFLELELGDWKDNRMYRLAAIDHGIFSFVDQKHNVWPVVLVTNPKHALYVMPGREPIDLIPTSRFIRILAFSDVDIVSVKMSYNKAEWTHCRETEGPLYVCDWSPDLYLTGLHTFYVEVVDELEKIATIEHQFSLDGTPVNFDIKARILLMLNAGVTFQAMFGTMLVANVLPLVILRFQKRPPRYHRGFGKQYMRKLWLLTKIDRVFYPIVLYAIYLPIGPWAVGHVIDESVGVIFAWGIIVNGTFLPEPFTYMYGGVQVLFVQIPLVFVLAHALGLRLYGQNARGLRRVVKNFPFILLLTIQLVLAYFFWLEYGTMSFIFGPLRTWSVGLSTILWYKIMNLPTDYCSLRNLHENQRNQTVPSPPKSIQSQHLPTSQTITETYESF